MYPSSSSPTLGEAPGQYLTVQPFSVIEPQDSCEGLLVTVADLLESNLELISNGHSANDIVGWYEIERGQFAVAPLDPSELKVFGPFLASAFVNTAVFFDSGRTKDTPCAMVSGFWRRVENSLRPEIVEVLDNLEGVGESTGGTSPFVLFAERLTQAWYQ